MDILYTIYYSLHARLMAILHKICNPKHDVVWRYYETEQDKLICPNGDIVCNTCNILFFCRTYDIWEQKCNLS